VSLVVGLLFEVTRGLAMTFCCVGVAKHVGDLGRLALIARGSLVFRSGPVMRWTPPAALIVSHLTQASADPTSRCRTVCEEPWEPPRCS
jgi:hypothetical protein